MASDPTQFLGLPSFGQERADVLLLPLPVEKTVSYGTGTARGPQAILEASLQLETFDEETLVEFAEAPRLHTFPPLGSGGEIEECLNRIRDYVRPLRGKFLLALGGEHTVTYGLVTGLVDDPAELERNPMPPHSLGHPQIESRKPVKFAGISGILLNGRCDGERRFLQYMAVTKDRKLITMVYDAPKSGFDGLKPAVETIAGSVILKRN